MMSVLRLFAVNLVWVLSAYVFTTVMVVAAVHVMQFFEMTKAISVGLAFSIGPAAIAAFVYWLLISIFKVNDVTQRKRALICAAILVLALIPLAPIAAYFALTACAHIYLFLKPSLLGMSKEQERGSYA